ncbi:MAG: class I SAM-dependent methyltransferase, partial [Tuberibacillus sp.]
MSHEHRFNPEKASLLLDPSRKEKLPPNKILALLELEKGNVVADLGSGNGFFTVPIAKSTETTVYAVDIEPKMLEGLKEYAKQEGVDNIQTITSDLANIQLPNNSVDKIFSSLVMHEVSDMDAMI